MEITKQHKATDEQITAIISKYKIKKNILTLMNETKSRAVAALLDCLENGAKAIWLAGRSYSNLILPEYTNDKFTRYSLKLRISIGKEIFEHFITNNPQYFISKPRTAKYAITDNFIDDLLFHDKKTDFDHLQILNLLRFIDNPVLVEKIATTFYLPFVKGETMDDVRIKSNKRKERLVARKRKKD